MRYNEAMKRLIEKLASLFNQDYSNKTEEDAWWQAIK